MQFFVRAKVKDKETLQRELETRVVNGNDKQGAKDRFEFLVESEGNKVIEYQGVVKR